MSISPTSESLCSSDSLASISTNITRYKTPGTKSSQLQRRHERLQAIKERRHASIDEIRNIHEVFEHMEQELGEKEQNVEPMDTISHSHKKKAKKFYANKLMLSEWLLDKPIDFEEKWLMKVCRKGVRNLVVAEKGKTKCFAKSGHFLTQFQSQLPGGSHSMPLKFTILDCVFQQEENTFFVLDVLVWSSYSVIHSSSEFRFFFIESKLDETSALQHICRGNEYKFIYTAHLPADFGTIEHTFAEHRYGVDGVLFYHSDVTYLSCITPLVGWLKAYMLPEVLSVPVHSDYLLEKPDKYTNFSDYICHFDKFEHKRNRKKHKRNGDVEMTEVTEESVMEN